MRNTGISVELLLKSDRFCCDIEAAGGAVSLAFAGWRTADLGIWAGSGDWRTAVRTLASTAQDRSTGHQQTTVH